jgi:hypothetical protein
MYRSSAPTSSSMSAKMMPPSSCLGGSQPGISLRTWGGAKNGRDEKLGLVDDLAGPGAGPLLAAAVSSGSTCCRCASQSGTCAETKDRSLLPSEEGDRGEQLLAVTV